MKSTHTICLVLMLNGFLVVLLSAIDFLIDDWIPVHVTLFGYGMTIAGVISMIKWGHLDESEPIKYIDIND